MRRLAAGGSLALCLFVTGCGTAGDWPRSDHFDGEVFGNPGVARESSVLGYLRLRLTTSQPAWPERVEPLSPGPLPQRVGDDNLRVTQIGHATLLIQTGGVNLLTDPVWSARASPFSFAGPKRVVAPAVPIDELPPIDAVLISHNHFDHLDLATLRTLAARQPLRAIVPLGNKALIDGELPGLQVSEHDWGEVVMLGPGVQVHVEPMQHGSGRSPLDQHRALWAAYMIRTPRMLAYFVGDSGYGDGANFRAAARKFGPPDLVLLPLGASEPASFMADSHMRPSEAVKAFRDTGARFAAGHHFDTFRLGFEAYGSASRELASTLQAAGIDAQRFPALRAGQVLSVPAQAR